MIDLDAADLIDSFSTGTYTVTRRDTPSYVAGVATAGGTSTFTITAAVVPSSGRDLLRLPEGRRSIESKTVYSATMLRVGEQGGPDADLISIDGANFEVQTSGQWPDVSTGFYVAIVQREGS